MYALTVKQPWAQAIAQFGKDVENRTRRPPRQLLGQRIAIHVGQSVIDWQLMRDGVDPYHDHRFDLYLWATHGEGHRSESVPHAGRIIATARMVGYTGEASGARALPMYVDAVKAAEHSPWFTGPVGWVLADVVMLLEPVGHGQCRECEGTGSVVDGAPGPFSDPYLVDCPRCEGDGVGSIRGRLGCWPLAPELVAQIHEQEQMARGRR